MHQSRENEIVFWWFTNHGYVLPATVHQFCRRKSQGRFSNKTRASREYGLLHADDASYPKVLGPPPPNPWHLAKCTLTTYNQIIFISFNLLSTFYFFYIFHFSVCTFFFLSLKPQAKFTTPSPLSHCFKRKKKWKIETRFWKLLDFLSFLLAFSSKFNEDRNVMFLNRFFSI